ncbi:hypothetical protein FQR65_LT13514 [Abscondita terminalis]|nr:hypothetical protein FQR65_LT13514 [Abscondita terminalis]
MVQNRNMEYVIPAAVEKPEVPKKISEVESIYFRFWIAFFCFYIINCSEIKPESEYPKWSLNFPEGSVTGMFLAVALPLSVSSINPYLAFNWEVNYQLPSKQSSLIYPPVVTERMQRKVVYDAFEMKLESQGFPGRKCLLRMICEAAIGDLKDVNGVLGDIVHILLKPSSSKNSQLSREYENAEKYGKRNRNCLKFNERCSFNFLDAVSSLDYVL